MKNKLTGKPLIWLVFASALVGISIDIHNKMADSGFFEALSTFKFFTLQSNLLVLIFAGLTILGGKKSTNNVMQFSLGPITSYIVLTGVVYLVILEPIYELYGMERVASVLLHYVTPPLMLLYWIFNEKRRYTFAEFPKWLVYPVLFMVWGIARAVFAEDYLYPFFDTGQYGYFIAFYLLLVALGFSSMVMIFIFVNNFYMTPYTLKKGK